MKFPLNVTDLDIDVSNIWRDVLDTADKYTTLNGFIAIVLEEFREFVKEFRRYEHYDYQQTVTEAIISSLIHGDMRELNILFGRQMGKTASMSDVHSFCAFKFPEYWEEAFKYDPNGIVAEQGLS